MLCSASPISSPLYCIARYPVYIIFYSAVDKRIMEDTSTILCIEKPYALLWEPRDNFK
jgi:hypothetical protein